MAWQGIGAWLGLVWHGSSTAGHPGILAAWRLAAFQFPSPRGCVCVGGHRLHFNANVGLAATSVVDIFQAESIADTRDWGSAGGGGEVAWMRGVGHGQDACRLFVLGIFGIGNGSGVSWT